MNDPEPIDSIQGVRDAWPTRGPWSPERTLSASEAAHELMRFLNYATREPRAALPFASLGYRLTGELATTAWLQPQLHRQLAQWAESLSRDPSLGHADYRGNEIDHTVAAANAVDVAQCFSMAAEYAAKLGEVLSAAQSLLAPLYHSAETAAVTACVSNRAAILQTVTKDEGGQDE